MTAIETDDLVIITGHGPLPGGLHHGELARVIGRSNTEVFVLGFETHSYGYLSVSDVAALSDVQRDNGAWDDFRYDSEDEEYVRLNGVHDYIYEGDDDYETQSILSDPDAMAAIAEAMEELDK